MANAKQATPGNPIIPDVGVRRLRAALILEEALETIGALGFDLIGPAGHQVDIATTEIADRGYMNMVGIADGCCDVIVVAIGTLSACGMCDASLMNEVLDSNDSKFAEGYRFNELGKLIKSPNYRPARIDHVLESQSQ